MTLYDVLFVPNLGFNLFLSHIVQENHKIIPNKTGAHGLDGRLLFPRRANGSSLRATRVFPGHNANRSTTLATFAERQPPPSGLLISIVDLLVVHPNQSGVSVPGVAATKTGAENYIVTGETCVGSDSSSGVYHVLAAAVLFPGGAFVTGNENKAMDTNHFHFSLTHGHSSVLKATAQQHGTRLVSELAPCAGCSMATSIIRAPLPPP